MNLRAGSTEKAVAVAEKKMKLKFPNDFRASLLLHDGQEQLEDEERFPWRVGCSRLQPLKAIAGVRASPPNVLTGRPSLNRSAMNPPTHPAGSRVD